MHPVSTPALLARINRRLAVRGERLRKARRWTSDTGTYYVIDVDRNWLCQGHVDPVALARQLGVLHPSEQIVEAPVTSRIPED